MEWLTGVSVPVLIGLVSSFGATWYTNRQQVKNELRAERTRSAQAIRAYVREVRKRAADLEEEEINSYGRTAQTPYDGRSYFLDPGSTSSVRAAPAAAEPHLHLLKTDPKVVEECWATGNTIPGDGKDRMEDSDAYAKRADCLEIILQRGLMSSG